MKTYDVATLGEIPKYIQEVIDKVHGQSVDEYFPEIDRCIDYYVCGIKECHGNVSENKSGWMCKKGGLWIVAFEIR